MNLDLWTVPKSQQYFYWKFCCTLWDPCRILILHAKSGPMKSAEKIIFRHFFKTLDSYAKPRSWMQICMRIRKCFQNLDASSSIFQESRWEFLSISKNLQMFFRISRRAELFQNFSTRRFFFRISRRAEIPLCFYIGFHAVSWVLQFSSRNRYQPRFLAGIAISPDFF